jgi:protein-S-isoprenylcysteine O-methyltransferase Ste14
LTEGSIRLNSAELIEAETIVPPICRFVLLFEVRGRQWGLMAIAFDLVGQQWQRKIIVAGAAFIGIGVLMAMQPVSPEDGVWHELVERSGIVFIVIGILGRTWCSMYIGGNKLNHLVTEGPYSVTRNPLYVFSAIAAFGLGAQLGSAVFGLICAAVTIMIFALVVSHEERAMELRFPAEFAAYKAKVPRFLPNFRNWHEADTLLVRPALVRRTFWDATLFLLAAPALKALESLRDATLIAPLFRLY